MRKRNGQLKSNFCHLFARVVLLQMTLIGFLPSFSYGNYRESLEKEIKTNWLGTETKSLLPDGFDRLYSASIDDDEAKYFAPGCLDSKDCPPYLAGLSISYDGHSRNGSNCTGVLIKPDVVLTNRHCLPSHLISDRNSKLTSIVVYFGRNGATPPEQRIVAYLIGTSPSPNQAFGNYSDFAYLKLSQPSNRKPIDIDRSGVSDREEVSVFSFLKRDDYTVEFVKYSCQTTFNTIFDMNFLNPKNMIVHLTNCPIVAGNSGSPIVNKSGKLVGLISGQLKPNLLNGLQSLLRIDGLLVGDALKYRGWGTNMACIPDPDPKKKNDIASECERDETNYSLPQDKEIKSSIQAKLNEWLMENSEKTEKWKLKMGKNLSDSNSVFIIPNCIEKSIMSDSAFQTKRRIGNFSFAVDVDGRPVNRLSGAKSLEVEMHVSERVTDQNGRQYKLFEINQTPNKVSIVEDVIYPCPNN